ncbi:hypothetical protein LXL04_002522 [Taraxacum kok-saghyz]
MALKLLIFMFPMLIASCVLAEMKIYCTPEDEVAPKIKDGDKKECPNPKGGGSGDKKDGGGGKDRPNPKGDGGDAAPKGGDGGKDCPDPKGAGGDCAPPSCPDPKAADGGGAAPNGGSDGKDCPYPKGADGNNVTPKGGGDDKDCPDPKGASGGNLPPPCPDPKGANGGVAAPPYPNPKGAHGGDAAPKGGGDGKDCPVPKDANEGGVAPPCPDPKVAGGGCIPPPCPKPKGAEGSGANPKGGGDGKYCPDPKGAGGGGGRAPPCLNPKEADGNDTTPKGGSNGKDRANPKHGDDAKKKGGGNKNKDGAAAPFYKQPVLKSDYKGEWTIHNPNVGISAIHHQLMPNNKAVWFDTTNLGPSALELGPKGNCPPNPDNNNEPDCFAHGVLYDIETGGVRTVYIETDPWCSSGHMLPSGDLLSTGGHKMGEKAIRLLMRDDPCPMFVDRQIALGAPHWLASNLILEDGSAAIIGGRDSYSYDLVPPTAGSVDFKPHKIDLPFLKKTTVPPIGPGLPIENNLYPFVYLLPDGNIFIFANDRAISFNPQTGKTVKEYPVLQGGSRNYPPSGQSAILPLRLTTDNKPVDVEVVVCGGNKADAFANVDPRYTQNRVFAPALSDCSRIVATSDNPKWKKEQQMPSPRVMGDLLQLPNGQFLFINGAKKGTSGWDNGEDPNLTPTVYMPENAMGDRFKELKPTNIPRMYHSVSCVLPDGKILVAGSNCHQFYTFDGPYPTELRVEKFSPHYLDPKFEKDRPVIIADTTYKMLRYGKEFVVTFTVASNPNLTDGDIIVTLLKPPFTTHGYSQNQRMLVCGIVKFEKDVITAVAPANGKIAPPGYYILYVNHRNIPSKGLWVQVGV